MFNFTLSNFFSGYKINLIFMELISGRKECLKAPINFNQVAGSFPFNTWNGGYNSCLDGNIVTYNEMDTCFESYAQALRLNFSSIVLEKEDFYNNYNRMILDKAQNGSTAIEIANLQLYEYIKEKYPHYTKFILSPTAWEIIDLTPEMVNVILENPDFQLASLPPRLAHNFEYIDQITQKSKIEICVNPVCPAVCKNYSKCILAENLNQYDFSGQSVFTSCPKTYIYNTNPQTMSLEDIKEEYVKKGITHFRLATCPNHQLTQYFAFLVKYFIKEEYQAKFLEEGLILIASSQQNMG